MKKTLFLMSGAFSLVLGLLGIILPLLPTTPLLLLALYCFTRSSMKLSVWLKSTAVYKKHLQGYEREKALTIKQKLTIQISAGIMMLASFLLIQNTVMRIIIIIALVTQNYIFIFRIRTYKPECNKKRFESNIPISNCDKKKVR